MNYHLSQNGQDLGVFPLEELRRRRTLGTLTGTELVWCSGMAEWQPLDAILRTAAPAASPPPLPVLPPERPDYLAPILVGTVLLIIVVAVWFGRFAIQHAVHRFVSGIQAGINLAPRRYTRDGNAGVAAASQPVLASTNGFTATQSTDRAREFRTRQYVQGYKLRGERNPATDALALGLLQNWIGVNYNGPVDTNLPPLIILADELATNPACTDPLVQLVAADNCVELHETVRRLQLAVDGFKHSRHLGYPQFYATILLGNDLWRDDPSRLASLDSQSIQHFSDALTDGSLTSADQAEIAEILVHGWGENFFYRNAETVINLVKSRDEPFAWLALVLQGRQEINLAWRARGGGYAGSVSTAGWQGFNDHLTAARSALTRAWQSRPDQPLAPELMIYVSLGNSGIDEMRTWFDRSVAAQIDYDSAWSQMRWGLRPRWYGSEAAMLAFGTTALNTKRFDTLVPYQMFYAVGDLESEASLPPGETLFGRPDIWPLMQRMYEGYLGATTGSRQHSWRSAYAVVSYLAGKMDLSAAQLAQLNWQPDHFNLTGWNRDLSLLAPEVAARTGPQSNEVDQAENLRTANDYSGALKIYRQLAATADLTPPARHFVEERIATLDLENRLHTGQWVDFLPATTNLAGWQVERGRCKLLPDGALEVRSDENGHLLYSRARVGNSFEVRGQFELVSSSDRQFQGGLTIGLPQFESYNWYGFRIKRNTLEGDIASYSQNWTTRQAVVPATINAGTNTFWLSFYQGQINASVNGREIFQKQGPPRDSEVIPPDFLLGLGAFNDANATVIRYRNLQVHLIPGQNFNELNRLK